MSVSTVDGTCTRAEQLLGLKVERHQLGEGAAEVDEEPGAAHGISRSRPVYLALRAPGPLQGRGRP